MQDAQQSSANRFSQFCYSITAGISGVVIGTTVGWNSPVTHLLTKGDVVDNTVYELVIWKVTGYYCLGTAVGGLVQGLLAKRIGYRWSAVVYDLAVFVGWLVLLLEVNSAPDWPRSIMVGRFVQGFGIGGLGLLTPTYISHITNFDLRGRAQIFHQAYVYFGVFYSYAFAAITTYAMLIGVCMIWPVFHSVVTLFLLPESPYFLYTRNDRETLKTVMRRIKGTEYDVDSDYKELEKYMKSSETTHGYSDSASTSNATARLKKRGFVIGAGLVIFQQLCGVNLCTLHMEHVFGELGSTDDDTYIKTRVVVMVVALVQVLLCLILVELVEFLGRKFMLIISALCMCLSMTMLTYYAMSTVDDGAYEGTEWRNNKITILVSYVCSYSVGWGPVVMLLYTETVRFDKWYSSLIYAVGQFVDFLLVYTFSNTDVLKGTYVSCASVSSCILSIVFVWYFVPETRGLHLNQIQTLLDNNKEDNRLGHRDAESCFQNVKKRTANVG